jgi:hypothetical protein
MWITEDPPFAKIKIKKPLLTTRRGFQESSHLSEHSVLQELAPLQLRFSSTAGCRLPGVIGPVPQPALDKSSSAYSLWLLKILAWFFLFVNRQINTQPGFK